MDNLVVYINKLAPCWFYLLRMLASSETW